MSYYQLMKKGSAPQNSLSFASYKAVCNALNSIKHITSWETDSHSTG